MQEMLTIKGLHVAELVNNSDEDLIFSRQMGVEYVEASPLLRRNARQLDLEDWWNADALVRFREYVESFGLKLIAMHLPLTSVDIAEQRWPNIMLGTSNRDRDIEQVCKCIEAVGKAGIPLLLYNLSVLPVVRNPGWASGRGGITLIGSEMAEYYARNYECRHNYFDYDKMKDEPLHPAGPISAEQAWERIEYFIKCVIPVAEECKVKMACHPNDVSVPPGTTYRGIAPVLSNIDGLKRFIDLHPSPYHGLSFCQGCISEFCTNPEQVYEAIRYFGSRKKIFYVHFRNIRGGFLKFEETFPDEGDIDMLRAMRIYKEVGYDGVFIPDHVPRSTLDSTWGHRAHAFCLGYIKALIQAVESEN